MGSVSLRLGLPEDNLCSPQMGSDPGVKLSHGVPAPLEGQLLGGPHALLQSLAFTPCQWAEPTTRSP